MGKIIDITKKVNSYEYDKTININSIDEMAEYYIEGTNTYDFGDRNVNINCDIEIKSNIEAVNLDGNEIVCRNIKAEYEVYAKRIVSDIIDCEDLSGYEVTCDRLKSIRAIDVAYLSCPEIIGCGEITAKDIETVDIDCYECNCETLKYVNKKIDHLNYINQDN